MGLNKYIKVGSIIKEIRKSKGITQKHMAENILNIPVSTYSNYENNNRVPDNDTLQRIAVALSVTVQYLISLSTLNNEKDRKFLIDRVKGSDEILNAINKFIPEIKDLIKSTCISKKHIIVDVELTEQVYINLALIIADKISSIDFYSAYDLFDSEIYENLNKYFKNLNAAKIINNIKKDIKDINIYDEIKTMIKEVFYDEFYSLELRESISEVVNNKQLSESIISSIYNSEIIKNITVEVTELIEINFFNILIKDILAENLDKLNDVGKEKVLDYVIDLLSNERYKNKSLW